jgi:hypothetical protein
MTLLAVEELLIRADAAIERAKGLQLRAQELQRGYRAETAGINEKSPNNERPTANLG